MREPDSKPLLKGRRILFVVPPARFDEGQFYQSWQLLSEEGAWLTAASDSPTGIAAGESGASVRTVYLPRLDSDGFDAIVLLEGSEDAIDTVSRARRFITGALAAGRAVAAFGKTGAELLSAGLPVLRNGRNLARFLAELAVLVSRQPEIVTPAVPEPVGRG